MVSPSRAGAHVSLQVIVLLWGCTAILGRVISIQAIPLVWYRMVLVTVFLGGYLVARRIPLRIPPRTAARYAIVGAVVGVHWLLFYGTVKVAGIATAVLTLSTVTFFTAVFEPFVFRRRVAVSELVIGAVVVVAAALLVRYELHATPVGLALGISSSVFSALFGVFNGKLAHEPHPARLMFYELGAGGLVVSLCFAFAPGQFVAPSQLAIADAGWLVVFAIVCTAVPQIWILIVMRTLSPFTVSVAVNLEPVYALILAAVLFRDEAPTTRFYVGSAILFALVTLNAIRKPR